MPFDRDIFFSKVRQKPFAGSLTQQQVDGMNYKLNAWEIDFEPLNSDLRWIANCLAQCFHETSQKMWPIEEYGKGGNASYAQKDPQTGQTYYGRGDIQLTWRSNYARADKELGLTGDRSCEWHAANALDPDISAHVMFQGMIVGWFRSAGGTPNNLPKYFSGTKNDVFNAREIVNGDKNTVPSWSNGKSIGNLIVGYHNAFLEALTAAYYDQVTPPAPTPDEPLEATVTIDVTIDAPPGVRVAVIVNTPEA